MDGRESRRAAWLLALVRATHAVPVLAVTAGATALAVTAGQSTLGTALCCAMVLTGQLSVGWSNDAWDWRRDAANARRDKPVAQGAIRPCAVWLAAGAAFGLCVPLSLAYGVAAGVLHILAVASGWTYNLWLKRTAWSWLPYGVSFGLLPAFVVLGLPGAPWPPAWAIIAGALLGVGAHFTNVLPDLDGDVATDVLGLPQRLALRTGARATRTVTTTTVPTIAATVLLLAATAAVVAGPPGPVDRLGVAALGTVVALVVAFVVAGVSGAFAARSRMSRLPFFTAIGVAFADIGLLVARGPLLG